MADVTNSQKIISLGTLSYNNDKMKEYIQSEIDKIPSSTVDDTLSDTSEHPVQNKVIKTALDTKADLSDISTVGKTGSYNDLSDKPTVMKPESHTHSQSDVTGLTTELNNKSDVGHKHTKSEITDFPTSLPASDVYDWAKADTKPTYTANEVGADTYGSADTALSNAKSYTDTKIADLINGAPSTLDTLGEIATAMAESQDVVDALNTAIGVKADKTDLTNHTSNKSNPHGVTKSQIGLENVGNFKAVSTVANQGLTDAEKANARNNIGAGTSSFSGSYNDLNDKPSIPSAVTENTVSAWGFTKNTGTITGIKMNGTSKGTSGVVDLGTVITSHQSLDNYVTTTDSRLSDARVPKAHTHKKSEITDFPSSLPANGGNADTVGGKQASDFLPNKAVCVNGADYDSFTTSGFFEVLGNANLPTQNAPNGNNTSNNFYLLVQSRGEQYCNQIAVSARTDLSVYVRTLYNGEWTDWAKINDGGNASTVNGLTVQTAVPTDAKFTDTVYTHPTYTARTGVPTANATPAFGGTFTVSQPVSDATGHITAINSRTITIPSAVATTSANGLMSSSDKSKLDGIATGATKVTVDSSLSTSSTNPVQNKVITTALNAKANSSDIPTSLPANGGNADTLENLPANKFVQNLGEWSSGDIKDLIVNATNSGFVTIAKSVTGMPVNGVYWYGFLDCNTVNRCLRITSTGNAGLTYSISYLASTQTWYNWHNTADGGNSATVGGTSVVTTASLGLHRIASGTATATTTNCPTGCWYGQHS